MYTRQWLLGVASQCVRWPMAAQGFRV